MLLFATTSVLAQPSRQPQANSDDGTKKSKTIGDILKKIDYFDKMFSNNWNDGNEIIIENFRYDIVLDMIKFTYNEKYEFNIEYIFQNHLYSSSKYS